jgi:hypothetical protein
MLLLLCEEALGTCELFRSRTSMDEDGNSCSRINSHVFNTAVAEDVRGVPICIDKEGAYYWYMADDRSVYGSL